MSMKLEQAARQIIVDWDSGIHLYEAITALREALGNSLKPKCFADYQPNHAIDRACASCPVAAECQTGEQAEQEPVAVEQSAPYGFCPICRRAGVSRERGINGNDTCVIGHKYASSEAIPAKPVKQEPVAWLNPHNQAVIDVRKKKQIGEGKGYPNFSIPLYAAPVSAEAIRSEELEAIYEEFYTSIMADLEHGIKSSNERAADKFKKEYPHIYGFWVWMNTRMSEYEGDSE